MMPLETIPFDAAEYLTTPEDHAALLSDALESGNAAYVTNALGVIARAQGMTRTADAAGVTRSGLHKALKPEGDPRLTTLLGVTKALGLRLLVIPV